jgi:hypothetical protein
MIINCLKWGFARKEVEVGDYSRIEDKIMDRALGKDQDKCN